MNWLDLVIALLVTLPTFFGFRKGFLRKLLGIVGIIAGFVLAVKFYDSFSAILSSVIKENKTFVDVISFLLIIGILYGASVWLSRFIANANSGTSIVDKVLGMAAGFLQGLIIASVLLYNLSLADIPSKQIRESSLLYSRVYNVAPAVFDKVIEFFPGLQDIYREYKKPFTDQTEPMQTEPQKNK